MRPSPKRPQTSLAPRRRAERLLGRLLLFVCLVLQALPCLATIELTAEEQKYLRAHEPILFISQRNYPPFEFVDAYGEHNGMCVELSRWMATEMGFKTRFTSDTFKNAQDAVLEERALVLTSLFHSDKREEKFDFTSALFDVPATIFVAKDRFDIRQLADLAGKRIAMQEGDYAGEFLEKNNVKCDVVYTKDFSGATDLVFSGQADAVIGDEQIVLYHIYTAGLTGKMKKVGEPLYIGRNCMAVKDGDTVLRGILNKGIAEARRSGALESISAKWLGSIIDGQQSWFGRHRAAILWGLGIAVFLALAAILWNVRLRSLVRARTRELQWSEDRFRAIAEYAYGWENWFGNDGRLLWVNEAVERLSGYTKAECMAMPNYPLPIVHEEDREDFGEKFRAAMKGSTGSGYEFRIVRRDGRQAWAALYWQPILNSAGERIGHRSSILDITERKEFETQLQHTQKLESLGVLAGGIAHDFNNILMGILGNADLALMDLPENAEVRRNIERIVTSSQRAADLCRQMLAYSGRGSFVIQPLDLSDLLQEMQHFLAVSVSKGVETVYELAEEIPAVEADVTQLRQIIMNLVINASDAIGAAGGRIRIRTGARKCAAEELRQSYLREELPPGLYVYIQVEDNGAGMDDETIKRIFDPFFTTKFQGRGLGLAAVLGIVRAHRGAIRVSSARGVGSTFTVFLPASTRSAESLERVARPDVPTRGTGTVLFVDDEESVREVGRAILHKAGFTVLTARDGEEALDVYTQEHDRIDVVVLDLTMPRRSGLETLKALRTVRSNVRVIISSGYSEDESVNQFEKRDLAGFIQKPYRPIDLTAKIHDALKRG
jgi:two-component system cell cycle sensor histidine kinase/response regulator CckA